MKDAELSASFLLKER